jgi:hypothetical protein
MKNAIPTILFVAAGLIAPVFAQTAAPAPAAPAASTLPPEVQAALDRAKAAMANAPARGGAAAMPMAQAAMPMLGTFTAPNGAVVNLRAMNENRSSTGTGTMSLQLMVLGGDFAPGAAVRRTTVTRAVDDKDRSLMPVAGRGGIVMSSPISMASSLMAASRGGMGANLNGSVTLGGSKRDAQSIKVVEGELEIYAPSAAGGSVITIPNYTSRAGKPLDEAILTANGIEIIILTAETFPAIRMRFPNAAEPNFAAGPVLYVRDPGGKLAGYVFRDANDGILQMNGSSGTGGGDGGTINSHRFTTPVPADAKLSIYVETPDALKKLPFRFENVALP